jgi:hypothetical protein
VNRRRIVSALLVLGVKGILCLACLSVVAFALVTYTATVTVTPTLQLTTGATSASWNFYVNEVNQIRYLPGGFSESTLNAINSGTYAT